MLQVRKLVLAIAAATTFTSGFAHALGLGQMSVKSSLNQPLNAEIELLEVRNLSNIELRAGLASPSDFARAGIDRQFFLTGLKFTPVVQANGRSFIRVTSNQPVNEPYLNFMMEVMWPEGRLLREYTMLLDPPSYKPQPVVYRQAPARVQSTTQRSAPAEAPRRPAVQPVASAPTHNTASVAATGNRPQAGSQYRVQPNDRLWNIATSINQGANIHQTMLAIQDLNPQAFANGNINRLKAGALLDLPTANQIAQRSQAQALAEVQAQAVQPAPAAPSARQVDATPREEVAAPAPQAAKQDSLRLVADQGDSSSAGDSEDQSLKNLNDQLANARESLDSSRLQNQELQERVQELESQLEKLQKLVELKDSQLAGAQQSAAEVAATEEVAEPLVPAPDEAVEAVAQPEVTETPETEMTEEQPQAILEPLATEEAEVEAQSNEAAVVSAPEPVTEPEVAPVQPEPVSTPEADYAPTSLLDDVLANPVLVAALGGGVLLLLLLLLLRKRKQVTAQEYDELDLYDEQPEANTEANLVAATTGVSGASLYQPGVVQEAEEVDVLEQVDWFFSQASYIQAAELLERAIEVEPHRLELRERLVEAYGYLGNLEAFQGQLAYLADAGFSEVDLNRLKYQFPDLAQVAAPIDSAASVLAQPSEHQPFSGSEVDLAEDDFGAMLDEIQLGETTPALELDDQALGLELGRMETAIEELQDDFDQPLISPETVEFNEHELPALSLEPELETEIEAELDRIAEEQPEPKAEVASEFEDMGFLANTDMVDTKLALATTYIDMGELESAELMLQEVMAEGSKMQKETAEKLLANLG